MSKVAKYEDPELISLHQHTKITTTYSVTIYENNLKVRRKYFSQLNI